MTHVHTFIFCADMRTQSLTLHSHFIICTCTLTHTHTHTHAHTHAHLHTHTHTHTHLNAAQMFAKDYWIVSTTNMIVIFKDKTEDKQIARFKV